MGKMPIKEKILVGLCITGLCGIFGYTIIPKILDEREANSRGYVVPRKLNMEIIDLDRDGKMETIASYGGENYLFKLGTNGVPYLERIKGLETKVEE